MKKNNFTFIWEGRGGSNETKNSLAQVLRGNWWIRMGGTGKRGQAPLCGTGGLGYTFTSASREWEGGSPWGPAYFICHRVVWLRLGQFNMEWGRWSVLISFPCPHFLTYGESEVQRKERACLRFKMRLRARATSYILKKHPVQWQKMVKQQQLQWEFPLPE